MNRQRTLIAAVAIGAIIGCFLPFAHAPIGAPVAFLQIARKIALGLFVLVLGLTMIGERSREMTWPRQLASAVAVALVGIFCVYRIVVLNVHRMPTFDEDDPRAGAFYRKACDGGEMAACALLGSCYWTGTCGVIKDGPYGVELFQKACDGGDMGACGQLGVCYEFGGCGLPKNGTRAVSLYERACAGGEMDTCNNLGVCYHQGQCGLSRDDTRAAGLFRKACKGGESGACHNLTIVNP
jgi:hypothetical protein